MIGIIAVKALLPGKVTILPEMVVLPEKNCVSNFVSLWFDFVISLLHIREPCISLEKNLLQKSGFSTNSCQFNTFLLH